ncbi:hypothetical protein BLA29_015144, partial [Euroglyphus maynei]
SVNGQLPISLATTTTTRPPLPQQLPPPPPTTMVPMIPPVLQALYNYCARIYPDQPNPLQVSAVVKFWYLSF